MSEFEEGEEIVRLTQRLNQIIDTAIEENYFGQAELEEIQVQMVGLIEQGNFWLKQENRPRFIYDLRNFLTWLIKYVEIKENEGR